MRTRFALVIVALAAVASACGGSSSPSTAPTTGTTTPVSTPTISIPSGGNFDCAKYVNTSAQISRAMANSFSGSVADFDTALNALKSEFNAIKDGAPSDVKSAIDDMVSAMTDIGKIRANPSSADASHLQTLAAKMPTDGAKISAYIASKCGH